MSKTFFLYKITNVVDGKAYVGTTDNIKRRWGQHKLPSSRCLYVRNAIQKHGVNNFTFETLEVCVSKESASNFEIAAIKGFNTRAPNGYNLSEGGEGSVGYAHSKETKQRMSEKNRGQHNHNFGKHLSEETKQRIGRANRGKQRTKEARRKMSEAKKGSKNPSFGKLQSRDMIQKRMEARTKWTDEQRHARKQKISIALKRYHQERRAACQ